jgi:hypothetical protein
MQTLFLGNMRKYHGNMQPYFSEYEKTAWGHAGAVSADINRLPKEYRKIRTALRQEDPY